MIVVDIETSGNFEPQKIGIWQIGAVDFDNPKNTFLEESRIDEEDEIVKEALMITGKTEKELRNENKQPQKDLLKNFFDWAAKIENKTLVAHNTPFDYGFLFLRAKKYGLEFPFGYKTFDLHVIAAVKYFEINREFLMEEGNSKMNLPNILQMCGMKDERIQMKDNKIIKEGKPHNALEDAKLTAECLSRILYGKGLFEEYNILSIPEVLRK
ncbi:MAG: 3'-5' exonuclease [Nanoarchaeota archaeon]|nr:3'-5' exonuclease [Nanoarchaeota archaeon]